MGSEVWRQITELTADAMELPPGERLRFLEDSAPNEEVLNNVLRLIEEYEKANDSFLAPLARLDFNFESARSALPRFAAGDLLDGRFRIVRFIAKGGMGEVYEAWDSVQGSRVALKTIRPDVVASPRILGQFKEEVAQSLQVSHRNVCRVQNLFVVREGEGTLAFLAMEFLDGETLADRIEREGRFSPQAALPLVKQVADGLSAAHDAGIVHRDLKSRNIMLAPEGGTLRAVIMDFGLACMAADMHQEEVEGTPAYMAPEQLAGSGVGLAADQYSLGVVLFEMMTGRLPFEGATFTQIAHGRKRGAPPSPRRFSPDVPDRWEKVILRCLAEAPEQRFPSVGAAVAALSPRRAGKAEKLLKIAACVLAAGLAGLAWRASSTEVLTNVVPLDPSGDVSDGPSLSEDGSKIVYESNRGDSNNTDIWFQDLRNGTQRRLTTDPARDTDASISPDGSMVAFRSERNGGGIYVVRSDGTGERLLAPYGRWARFSPDGKRIAYWVGGTDLTASAGVFVIPAAGGVAERVFAGFADARVPTWRDDGKALLARACKEPGSLTYNCDWWAQESGSQRAVQTHILDRLRTADLRPVGAIYQWTADKVYLSTYRGSEYRMVSVPMSAGYQAGGALAKLTSSDMQVAYFSRSSTGRVAFSRFATSVHISHFALNGQPNPAEVRITTDSEEDCNPSVSADGRWLVFSRYVDKIILKDMTTGRQDIIASFSGGGDHRRLAGPVIDREGEWIAFEDRSARGAILRVLRRTGGAETTCSDCGIPTGWMPGARKVIFTTNTGKIGVFDISTGKKSILLDGGTTLLDRATANPRGTFLLFTGSTREGAKRVFIARMQSPEQADSRWTAVTEEGSLADAPQWSAEGDRVFYLSSRDARLCVWSQRLEGGRMAGQPREALPYHESSRRSPKFVYPSSVSLAVDGTGLYLNAGELSASVLVGEIGSELSSWFRFNAGSGPH